MIDVRTFLFQCSDHTWQAYNRWPDHFALYDDGKNEWYWGGGVQVGFNRPTDATARSLMPSPRIGEFLLWEFPTAFWMENGYDVTTSPIRTPTAIPPDSCGPGMLSVGHDEYWTP